MSFKTLVLGLGLVVCLTSAQSNYDLLKDAYWSTVTEQSDSHCRIDVQFYYRNYLSLNTGETCATPGLFAGTFALSATDIYVQYASTPASVPLTFMKFAYAITNNGNTLTLTAPGLTPVVLQKQPADALRDGVWDGQSLSGSLPLRTFFLGDTYISWTLNPTSTDGYFGRAPRTGNTGSIIFGAISTSYTPAPWNISQVYSTSYGFGPAPYFNITVAGVTGGEFTARRAADTLFDGTWAGLNGGCYETVEFNRGLFRDYKVACTGKSAIMGVYDRNNTHVTVRYGFSDVAGLKDQVWTFPYDVSADGLNLTIHLQDGSSIKYFKAAAPSNARRVTVTLSTDYNSWTPAKLQGVLAGLASFLGIPVANIEVVGTSSGSVVLDAVVFDDVVTRRTAAAAVAQLRTLRSVGGYDVRVVDPLNPNPSAGSALLPSFILSAVTILVALFVRA